MRWPWSRRRSERADPTPGAATDVATADPHAHEGGALTGVGAGELHLVKVAYAANLPEAELIQGLLSQERIPSMVRRNGAFDIPDYLAAGGRDILVPVSQADRARELLQ